ncbi:hypothetical protein BGZ79_001080 [Entomortierella chlamydospora]|nr:hypothetical protein BGZ79_001080 [Entomortierella chlamydospora]
MDMCYNTGCNIVYTLLNPCGGGVTNSSLQQDLTYTPTASLGGCECNSYFYNSLLSCLSCISAQGENSPEIQDQPDWVDNCLSYGFNFTDTPITTSTGDDDNSSGGLSKGAIAGIVIGAIVLIILIIVCAWLYLKGRKGKQGETEFDEKSGTPSAAAAAGTTIGTTAASASHYHNPDYPNTYDQQDNYYPDQNGYGDSSAQYPEDQSYFPQHAEYSVEQQNNDYYGVDDHNNTMMMQNFDHGNNGDETYVPPPPHPASDSSATVVAGGSSGAYSAVPRPSDSFPQSLRSRPKGWDSQHSYANDKAEFEDGEELEPPRTRYSNDQNEFTARRSVTPTRASYRDDFSRPSFEREPRPSGSDFGSASGSNMVRGVESGSNNFTNYDHSSDAPQDSPESARRRARAAELFSAESTRR